MLHLLDDALDNLLLRANLLARNETAERIHIEQGTNTEHGAHETAQWFYTAALDVKGEISGEEPVPIVELVGLRPLGKLVDFHALCALF